MLKHIVSLFSCNNNQLRAFALAGMMMFMFTSEANAALWIDAQYDSGITATGVTLNAYGSSTSGVTYATSFDYGLTNAYGTTVAGLSNASFGNWSTSTAAIAGLTCGTTYHFRVNVIGAVSGGDTTFTTSPCVTISSQSATAITATGVTLNASGSNATGAPIATTFEYGPTAAYGTTVAGLSNATTGNWSTSTAAITGLTCGTTYHFRINVFGAVSGGDTIFTTSACSIPTLSEWAMVIFGLLIGLLSLSQLHRLRN